MKYVFPSQPIRNNRAYLLFLFFSLIALRAIAQGPGCPNVNAGEDIVIDCTTNACTDLTATFLATGISNTYDVTAIPYVPPFPYLGLANPIGVGVDDVWSGVINLPFEFCYFEDTYNEIQVGSNGVIRFEVDPLDGTNQWTFNEDIPNNAVEALAEVNIFGVGHDIDPSVLGSNPEIAWDVIGESPCRTFVVSFANVANFTCTDLISTSQIILYETTNAIEIYIEDKPTCNIWNNGNAIVGIQNNDGDTAFVPPGRNTTDGPWTATNEAWRFTPNGTPNYVLTWYDDNGDTVGNTPEINVCPTETTIYTAEVTYTNCNGDVITVTDDVQVTSNSPSNPNAGEDGAISLCIDGTVTIDLFDSLGGTPDPGGTWTPPLNSGTGVFDPTIDPAGTYTYSVSGAPCPDDDANVEVSFSTSPNTGEEGTLAICESDNAIDLFTLLGGTPDTGGTWTPALASGTGIFDPSIDPDGTYTYTIEAMDPCVDSSTDVVVTTSNPINAGEDGMLSTCNSAEAVDLFTILGGTPDIGGTWTPALNSGTGIFDPSLDPAGNYMYTVTGIAPCPDATAEIVVSIENEPNAGENGTLSICDSAAAVDLFTLLGGTPNIGGTWTPILTSGTGIFDPSIDPAGTYTYTVAGIAPCSNDTSDVVVTIENAPNAGENGTLTICDIDSEIDLFTLLGGTPDNGGTWTPVLASGTGVFDPAIDPTGTYTYTITGIAPCPNDTSDVVVTIENTPNAGENNTLSICNAAAPIDLFTLLGGAPDNGGTWAPVLTSGTGVFDPTIDPADTYVYTVNGIAPCPNDSAEIVVSIITAPDAGEDGTITLCNIDNAIDLFDSIGGTPNNGGTWTPLLTSNTGIFDPSIDPPGTYTYSIDIPGCEIDSSNVIVTINQSVNAGEDTTLTLCPTDDSVNLFTLLGGTPDNGGSWLPPLSSGTGVFDPTIDAPGLYTYTVNGIAPCPIDTAEVIVILNNSPNAIQPDDLRLCDTGGDNVEPFNLEQQSTLITADNLDYRATYHLTQVDADNDMNRLVSPYNNIANPQTIYTRVEDINSGCFNTSVNFDLVLDDTVIANPDFYELCDDNVETDNNPTNDSTTFNLSSRNPIILGPTQAPGDYTVSYHLTQDDANNDINALPNNYDNTINPQTLYVRVENNATSCFAISEIQLMVNPLPLFSLEERYILCFDSNGAVIPPSPIIDTDLDVANYTFEWYIDNVLIAGETNSSIEPNQTGTYSVEVTNTLTGCSSSRETVVIESSPPSIEAQQVSITFLENNEVLATATNNGTIDAFFEFSLDGGSWLSNPSGGNTYIFEDVPAGEHIITVRDLNGCGEASVSIILLDFIPYFTPNGDGFHDTWNIIGIENQPDAVLYIFNRYGKLLKQLSPSGPGWDGTFNNYVLPSSDYWFTLDYKDPNTNQQKNFKSHFTLKH